MIGLLTARAAIVDVSGGAGVRVDVGIGVGLGTALGEAGALDATIGAGPVRTMVTSAAVATLPRRVINTTIRARFCIRANEYPGRAKTVWRSSDRPTPALRGP